MAGALLCDATKLHDRGPDGRCRDCTAPLTPESPVCEADDAWGPWLRNKAREEWAS